MLVAILPWCQVNVGTYLQQSSRYVPTFQGNLLFLQYRYISTRLRDVKFYKIGIFTVTAVRNSNAKRNGLQDLGYVYVTFPVSVSRHGHVKEESRKALHILCYILIIKPKRCTNFSNLFLE